MCLIQGYKKQKSSGQWANIQYVYDKYHLITGNGSIKHILCITAVASSCACLLYRIFDSVINTLFFRKKI